MVIAEGDELKPVQLIDEQAFDIGVTFGWFKTANNKRRFRRRYKSVARQNGKTFENGIMGTYIAGFGGYNFGKLFTVATKKRQARLAWEEMSKFITVDEDLEELFKVQDKDNKLYKAIYNGTRALSETLVSMITTRGDRLNSFCKEMDDYCIKILQGLTTAEDFFVDIYSLDPDDDIWDEKNWIKANPFICSKPEGLEQLRIDADTAKEMGGSDLRDFITKCLNMWVQNTDDLFVNPEKWQNCATKETLKEKRGKKCWVGLDLSSGGDLTTLALEFEEENEEYYIYSHSFMPRGRLEEHIETDLAPYDLWEDKGLLTVTGGSGDYKNDYKFIIKHLKELQQEYDLQYQGIGIDPHNADGILSDLESFGCPILIVTQSAKFLNDATEDIQLAVKLECYKCKDS